MNEERASIGESVQTLDSRAFSWTNPVLNRYVHDFASVSSLFSGNSAVADDWRTTIRRVVASRVGVPTSVSVLLPQLAGRRAPTAALDAAARLARPGAVAVVTGQQAGLFGGPLYTLLKAITALRLARWVEAEFDAPAVPIFWVESEDHDWAEIRSATFLDRHASLASATAIDPPGAGVQPVAALELCDGDPVLKTLADQLAPTEFSGSLLDMLGRHYRPGTGVVRAFAGWMDELLGSEGLVVFEAHDPAAKPLAGSIFARELEYPGRTAALVRRRATLLRSMGFEPQVEPAEHVPCLFYLNDRGRHPLGRSDGNADGDSEITTLQREVAERPQRFSPNVLLRPIVQDRLFPTVCYVAGPSELVYQSQLKDVYASFELEPPLIHPRLSATLLDASAARFLTRYGLSVADLHADHESILRKLVARELPPGLEDIFVSAERALIEQVAGLRPVVAQVDQTLAGAVDTSIAHVRQVLVNLQGKAFQAAKRKNETLRRQLDRTQTLVFPGRVPQERGLSALTFLNRHGLALRDRLLELDPFSAGRHHVLTF